jgi:hypothetical protein
VGASGKPLSTVVPDDATQRFWAGHHAISGSDEWETQTQLTNQVTGMLSCTGSPQAHINTMRKNELSLVICYLAVAAGLVWMMHVVGTYYL